MAEPASAILTLIIFAYKASKSLHESVEGLKSQRQTVNNILTDLGALVTVLEKIRARAEHSPTPASLELLRDPLDCCAKTCQEMHDMLNECIKHSKDGRSSVQLWLKMRWRERDFDVMKSRLASYKSTLVIAFQAINIQDHSVTQESLEAVKNLISGTREDLEDQLERAQKDIRDATLPLQQILQEDQAQLRGVLESIEKAQRLVDTTPAKIVIENNKAGDESRSLFGTDNSKPSFGLRVANNEVGVGAVVSAGVHSPETLQALLPHSRSPDLALTLQALQTQSGYIGSDTVQIFLDRIAAGSNRRVTNAPHRSILVPSNDPDFTEGNTSVQLGELMREDTFREDGTLARPGE